MALTLLEAAKLENNPIRSGIIEEFARSSDLLAAIPFDDIQGNALAYNREDTLPGIGFRGVNEAFTESTGIINPQSEALVIAGGDLDVDRFIISTMGENQRAIQELMKVKALSLRITREIVKGDSATNPRVLDGLQRRITGTQLLAAGATSGGDALSLDRLDQLIDLVDMPTHLLMNKTMRRRLTAAARNTGIGGFIESGLDAFGRKIETYMGLPIIVVDYDNEGNDILPFTEANPGGGTPASTSIYCLSITPGMLTGIQNSGGIDVRDLGELETKPVFRTRVEWYLGMVIMHGRAAARLYGVRDAAVTA